MINWDELFNTESGWNDYLLLGKYNRRINEILEKYTYPDPCPNEDICKLKEDILNGDISIEFEGEFDIDTPELDRWIPLLSFHSSEGLTNADKQAYAEAYIKYKLALEKEMDNRNAS